MHDPLGKIKRFHLDDLIPFISQSDDLVSVNLILLAIEYSRDALGDVPGRWEDGQRVFDLSDLMREVSRWEEMGK